ncbi:MAG: NAD-dependent epimerase/dehydratase family protein [Arachnia sp.]
MRHVLVLGGTAWLGREIAQAVARTGAQVTCAARGVSGRPPPDVDFVRLDRLAPGAYEGLTREWDDVIELSHDPGLVVPALETLGPLARHWTVISSVSVYERNDAPGADESAATVEVQDTTVYAQAKVAAEQAARERLEDRLLVARPCLIVGPGDTSDRFGYWPARLAESADDEVLTPETEGRHVQVIDVADLAHWISDAGARQETGVVNAVGESLPMADFLEEAARVCGFGGRFVSASDEWLQKHDVRYWSGPRSLPLWLPQEITAMAQRNSDAFRAKGGQCRTMRETLSRALEDERARGVSRKRRSGLTRSEEELLLCGIRKEGWVRPRRARMLT